MTINWAKPAFLLVAWICCTNVRSADALGRHRFRDILQDMRKTDSVPSAHADDADVQELYFTQRLDHFDPADVRTYQQRYFVTDRYELASDVAAGEVTFLCVGGEGPGFDASVLIDSVHCSGDMLELAHRLNSKFMISVHVYALEHRYYGKSYPKFPSSSTAMTTEESPVTNKNLKYLSSRQALEDLAHFVSTMKSRQQQHANKVAGKLGNADDESIPWVTFGGSYPGFMAGMARYKYPHLIHSAVSNSAPLHLIVDFPQYQQRVGWDLRYEKIGGSQACYDIVKAGHEQAVDMVRNDPVHLGNMFHVCNPETVFDVIRNQETFLGDGLIYIPAQSNDPSCSDSQLCNIGDACEALIAKLGSDEDVNELDALAYIASMEMGIDNLDNENSDSGSDDEDDCNEISWQAMLENLAKPTVTDEGWRSWLWQTCTEVGFYQTCMEDCPYASFFHMVDMDLEICKVAYNITNVYENVQATADHYGDLDISGGSRILSVNGDVDPWSTLAIQNSTRTDLPAIMVKGASHHFWTHAVSPTDSVETQQVRELIYDTVMAWLGIGDVRGTPGNIRTSVSTN